PPSLPYIIRPPPTPTLFPYTTLFRSYAKPSLYDRPNSVAQLQAATSMIPSDAPVNADTGLTIWLANRHTINDFPDKLDGSSYVVDRKSTRLNSSHLVISYAVFCLKKK